MTDWSPFSLIAPSGQRLQAVYFVSIDGLDVSSNFAPLFISMTIKDSQGGKSDSLDIELDDSDGQIAFPRVGASVTAGIGWSTTGPVKLFSGKTDEPRSTGSRSAGRLLSISAKSADPKGKLKHTAHKHKDKAKFQDVANKWAKDAGLSSVQVHQSLASIEREYWSMSGENFMNWISRMAAEMGATAKIMGDKAVVIPRGSSASASGQALASIRAAWGDNLLSWSLAPKMSRPPYGKFAVRYYDLAKAKWMVENEDGGGSDGQDATLTHRYKAANKAQAKKQAASNKDEAKKESGGGSVEIIGNPAAQSQATCTVSGARPGVDGSYLIESATHKLTRSGGYVTDLELKQPSGDAGTDARKASK